MVVQTWHQNNASIIFPIEKIIMYLFNYTFFRIRYTW
jgi:hypothetical protein